MLISKINDECNVLTTCILLILCIFFILSLIKPKNMEYRRRRGRKGRRKKKRSCMMDKNNFKKTMSEIVDYINISDTKTMPADMSFELTPCKKRRIDYVAANLKIGLTEGTLNEYIRPFTVEKRRKFSRTIDEALSIDRNSPILNSKSSQIKSVLDKL